MEFGESFSGFDAQAVQIQILGVFAAFEQLLSLHARSEADGDQRESENIHLARGFRREEIGNGKPPAFFLARKSEAQQFGKSFIPASAAWMRALPRRLVYDYVITVALR